MAVTSSQVPPAFPAVALAIEELRNQHQVRVVSVSESVCAGQCMVFYIPGLFSSLLHGEMTRVGGGSAADTLTGKVHVVLLYSLGFSCLKTPVGLEYRQESRKMMWQARTLRSYACISNTSSSVTGNTSCLQRR